MKKTLIVFLNIAIPFFLVNLSQQSSSKKSCSGELFKKSTQEELIDIKIGKSKEISTNKNIVVYKLPENQAADLVEYEFSLDQTREIQTVENPSLSFNDEEYFKITVITKNKQPVDCIIKKREKLFAKVKETGWSVSYSFDQFDKVVINECITKEEEN